MTGSNHGGINHHVPVAQRVKRLWMLFQLPYSAGGSFHSAQMCRSHRTPFTELRLSLAVKLTCPGRPGRECSFLRHWDTLNSCCLIPVSHHHTCPYENCTLPPGAASIPCSPTRMWTKYDSSQSMGLSLIRLASLHRLDPLYQRYRAPTPRTCRGRREWPARSFVRTVGPARRRNPGRFPGWRSPPGRRSERVWGF